MHVCILKPLHIILNLALNFLSEAALTFFDEA